MEFQRMNVEQSQTFFGATRGFGYRVAPTVGGCMPARLILVRAEGALAALKYEPQDIDGLCAAQHLGQEDNGDVGLYQVSLLGDAEQALLAFNGLNDREGYSGTVTEQLSALQTALPEATMGTLIDLGQIHAADQFAAWMGRQFEGAGRAPTLTFKAQRDGQLTALPGQGLAVRSFRSLLAEQFGGPDAFVAYRAISAGGLDVELRVWVFRRDLSQVMVDNPFAAEQVAAKRTVSLAEARALVEAGLARVDNPRWCSGSRTEASFSNEEGQRVSLFVSRAGYILADADDAGDTFLAHGRGKKVSAFSVTGNGFAAGHYAFLGEDDVFIRVGRYTDVHQLVDGVLESVSDDELQDWIEDGTIVLPS